MKFLIILFFIVFSFANTKITVCGNLAKPIQMINKQFNLNLVLYTASSGELMSNILWDTNKYNIFISANKKFTDELIKYRLCRKSEILIYGKAILISKNLKLKSLNDILKAKKTVIANPNYAPFGKITNEILINTHLFNKPKHKITIVDNILYSAITLKTNYYFIPTKYYKPLAQTICLISKNRNI